MKTMRISRDGNGIVELDDGAEFHPVALNLNADTIVDDETVAFLKSLDCPVKIEVRAKCPEPLEPLVLDDVKLVHVSDDGFIVQLSSGDAERLSDFLDCEAGAA